MRISPRRRVFKAYVAEFLESRRLLSGQFDAGATPGGRPSVPRSIGHRRYLIEAVEQRTMLTSIALVADPGTAFVTEINVDTNTVIGSVSVPESSGFSGGGELGTAITANGTLGFVSDFYADRIYEVNLGGSPPTLTAGTNPIAVSTSPESMAVSLDQKYLPVLRHTFVLG